MGKHTSIILRRVKYVPKTLEPGVLYVAEEFHAAVHLCACGCGEKVSTPLRPTEWSLGVNDGRPSLTPSVGNWQLPCRSHYWIQDGAIVWSGAWTDAQVAAGRRTEVERREAYYSAKGPRRNGLLGQLWVWLRRLLGL